MLFRSLPNWFGNPAAFNQPCQLGVTPSAPTGCVTPTTTFGYLGGYNTTTFGPGYRKFDFSMFKAFQLSERFSLQFRAEFFNTFNHTNFSSNSAGVTSGGTTSASVTQANPSLGSFGEILGANDPRIMQFALKFSF